MSEINEKKVALVTGASRGIGAGIAESLAEAGYSLLLVCEKNEDQINAYAGHLHDTYEVDVLTQVGDISNEVFVLSIKDSLLSVFGQIDVLVNNAGIWSGGLLTDMSLATWNRLLNVNLTGTFLMCKYFAPLMVSKKSGDIINISSIWGISGASCEVAYSATKGGINAFTKALAKELAPSGIRVNALAPGIIDTDMNACFSEEEMGAMTEEIPMARIGEAKEIGDCVLSVINSPYMTGQVIAVDGGFL